MASVMPLRPLTRDEFESMTGEERGLRRATWLHTIRCLREVHERAYHAPHNVASLPASFRRWPNQKLGANA